MRYALGLLAGLVAGVGVAFAILYFNPLTRGQSVPASDSNWVLDYKLSAADTWLSTHDDRLEIPLVPGNVPLLWESGIKGSLLAAMPLHGPAGGRAAVASRISVPSADTEFLRAGLLVADYWLISVPGEGTVFVHAVNNRWPLLRDTVVRVDWLQRDWTGPQNYGPTRGPDAGGANVRGMTGQFAGARGHGRERVSLEAYDGSLAQLSGQLMLELPDIQL